MSTTRVAMVLYTIGCHWQSIPLSWYSMHCSNTRLKIMNTETFIGTLPGPFSAGIVSQPHPGPPLRPGSRSNTPVVSAPPLQPIPHFPPIAGRGTPLAPPIQAFQLRPPSSQSSDVRRAQSAQLLPLDASHRGQALTARAQFAPGEVVDIMILPCSGTKLQFVQASSQTLINPASSLTSIKRMYAKLQGAFAPDRVVIPVALFTLAESRQFTDSYSHSSSPVPTEQSAVHGY
ncbi:uncharacterized protein B0H18DRAFT_960710 [Fomitopsis serialis]|uniref:uncharacterized protein n=1 Tax=Fomitopsis serialis TaxID=139415 RepID=UPI0020072093|nr:uncharacterized protein B0H18DRAFT_960710 [Neoantrodia serialis]KAH9912943.1 hypothetical protein B0H18DRAFT_960710 [Neoantrodia serialis]